VRHVAVCGLRSHFFGHFSRDHPLLAPSCAACASPFAPPRCPNRDSFSPNHRVRRQSFPSRACAIFHEVKFRSPNHRRLPWNGVSNAGREAPPLPRRLHQPERPPQRPSIYRVRRSVDVLRAFGLAPHIPCPRRRGRIYDAYAGGRGGSDPGNLPAFCGCLRRVSSACRRQCVVTLHPFLAYGFRVRDRRQPGQSYQPRERDAAGRCFYRTSTRRFEIPDGLTREPSRRCAVQGRLRARSSWPTRMKSWAGTPPRGSGIG
jgi:hypothetical protein